MGEQNKDNVGSGYKIPEFKTKIFVSESDSFLPQTGVWNMDEIANGFGRPGYVLTLFFRAELLTLAKYYPKIGGALILGVHDAQKLGRLFEKFITKYVQCYACGSLETEFMASQLQISHTCASCAHVSEITMWDIHRSYIWDMQETCGPYQRKHKEDRIKSVAHTKQKTRIDRIKSQSQ